jgi:hypothetical protein
MHIVSPWDKVAQTFLAASVIENKLTKVNSENSPNPVTPIRKKLTIKK